MDNIVIFYISLDPETLLWDIVSSDPTYEGLSEYQIMGGRQFMLMQEITENLDMSYCKVAAFVIREENPNLSVIQVEHVIENKNL